MTSKPKSEKGIGPLQSLKYKYNFNYFLRSADYELFKQKPINNMSLQTVFVTEFFFSNDIIAAFVILTQ